MRPLFCPGTDAMSASLRQVVSKFLEESVLEHLPKLIHGTEVEVEQTIKSCLLSVMPDLKPLPQLRPFLDIIYTFRNSCEIRKNKEQSSHRVTAWRIASQMCKEWDLLDQAWFKCLEQLSILIVKDCLTELLSDPNGSSADKQIELVLDSLLPLPHTYPHIRNEAIHGFLRNRDRVHNRLLNRPNLNHPLVITHISYLFSKNCDDRAEALLRKVSDDDSSLVSELARYLKWVQHNQHPDICGQFDFANLSPEDVYLGACYGKCNSEHLEGQKDWRYKTVVGRLTEQVDGCQAANTFKVKALQPRIAEKVFFDIYERVHGSEAAKELTYKNLEALDDTPSPWTLHQQPDFPSYDWECRAGVKFDVKSNLWYRSSRQKTGISGFLINLNKRNKADHFPGIVFTNTSDDSCCWCYVGDYHPEAGPIDQGAGRVLPFVFRLPVDDFHFQPRPLCDLTPGAHLLFPIELRRSWAIASRIAVASLQEEGVIGRLYDRFIHHCSRLYKDLFLECAIWKALTKTTLDACCERDSEHVCQFLQSVTEFVRDPAFPVKYPVLFGKSILEQWIATVLTPLCRNWHQIRCARCPESESGQRSIQVQNIKVTGEGTVEGTVSCRECTWKRDTATIITHCHNCNHYPLVIGKNVVCRQCNGLICDWRTNHTDNRCDCCKRNCPRNSSH